MYKSDRLSKFTSLFKGHIVQVLQKKKENGVIHEVARRAPGVRMIIKTLENKFLISCERRTYLKTEWDYRIPGGKVVDTLDEYLKILESLGDQPFEPYIEEAVKKEAKEEVGITVRNPKLLHVSGSGGTIEWDLWYYEVTDFDRGDQALEHDEEIEIIEMTPFEVAELIIKKEMSEDRSRAVMIDYLIEHFPEEYTRAIKTHNKS